MEKLDNLSARIRHLFASGANDAYVEQFIAAAISGDRDGAARLLSSESIRSSESHRADLDEELLTTLRVEALRPMVNRLAAEDLYRFTHCVIGVSAVVAKEWGNYPALQAPALLSALANAVASASLAQFDTPSIDEFEAG